MKLVLISLVLCTVSNAFSVLKQQAVRLDSISGLQFSEDGGVSKFHENNIMRPNFEEKAVDVDVANQVESADPDQAVLGKRGINVDLGFVTSPRDGIKEVLGGQGFTLQWDITVHAIYVGSSWTSANIVLFENFFKYSGNSALYTKSRTQYNHGKPIWKNSKIISSGTELADARSNLKNEKFNQIVKDHWTSLTGLPADAFTDRRSVSIQVDEDSVKNMFNYDIALWKSKGYCGRHGYVCKPGATWSYDCSTLAINLLLPPEWSGCMWSFSPYEGTNLYSPNASNRDYLVSVIHHELLEMLSDPWCGSGYINSAKWENADKCNFTPNYGYFRSYDATSSRGYNIILNGHKYMVQGNWDNVAQGCFLT